MSRLILLLSLGMAQPAPAATVYQWRDTEQGQVHFSDTRPANAADVIEYRAREQGIYQWQDEAGRVYFGDGPPPGAILLRQYQAPAAGVISPASGKDYSIIQQAGRMLEQRREQERQRFERQQQKRAAFLIKQERAIARMQEKLRVEGYGPRPYPHNYSYFRY